MIELCETSYEGHFNDCWRVILKSVAFCERIESFGQNLRRAYEGDGRCMR